MHTGVLAGGLQQDHIIIEGQRDGAGGSVGNDRPGISGVRLSTPLLIDGIYRIDIINTVISIVLTITILWVTSLNLRSRQSMQGRQGFTSASSSMKSSTLKIDTLYLEGIY